MRAVALALLVLLASPAGARNAQVTAPAAAEPEASLALELAKLVSPSDALLDQQIATARAGFFGALHADPEFQAIEKEFPGIGQAVWDVLEPEARRVSREATPSLWEKLIPIYLRHLTAGEVRALIAFYASPTGQRAIRTMYGSLDTTAMFKDAIDSPDGKISAESLAAGQQAAKAKAVSAMGPEDEAALMALGRAMPIAKLHAVGREVQKATLEFLNEPDPENDARMEALVVKTMEQYMKEGSKRRR